MMDKPNTVSGVFKVKASAEFYDDEATVETLRSFIEDALEDYDADVAVLKKEYPIAPEWDGKSMLWRCGQCGAGLEDLYCSHCGRKVDWE